MVTGFRKIVFAGVIVAGALLVAQFLLLQRAQNLSAESKHSGSKTVAKQLGDLQWHVIHTGGRSYQAAWQTLRVLEQHYVESDRLNDCRFLSLVVDRLHREAHDLGLIVFRDQALSDDTPLDRLLPHSPSEIHEMCVGATEELRTLSVASRTKRSSLRLLSTVTASSDFDGGPLNEVPRTQTRSAIAALLQWLADLGVDDEQRLFRAAFQEVLRSLDPHSAFLSRKEYQDLRGGTRGQFGGVGVVINDFLGLPFVREIVPNSPAHIAGVEPNDVLLRIGSLSATFSGVDQALSVLREQTLLGPVAAWFFRPRSRRVYKTFVSRDEVPVASCEERLIPGAPDVLHVRVTGFSSRTAQEIHDIYLRALQRESGALSSMILDLRGNPGGLLDQAVQVSDLFLSEGKIVITRSRYESQTELASSNQLINLPLVVLVNSSSASASEIVAGALKDAGRAVVVGEQTFGKGSVQSLFEIGDSGALKLTIAHYFTPAGASIQNKGVMPNVSLQLAQIKDKGLWVAGSSERKRESDLAKHLPTPDLVRSAADNGDGPSATNDVPPFWALSKDELSSLGTLGEVSFSYPNFENSDSRSEVNDDAYVRVALGLLRAAESSEGGLWSLVRHVGDHTAVVRAQESQRILDALASTSPLGHSREMSGIAAAQAGVQPMTLVVHDREDSVDPLDPVFSLRLAKGPPKVSRAPVANQVTLSARVGSDPGGSPRLLFFGLVPQSLRVGQPGVWLPLDWSGAQFKAESTDVSVVLPRLFWTYWSVLSADERQGFSVRVRLGIDGQEQEVGVWQPSAQWQRALTRPLLQDRQLRIVEKTPQPGWRTFVVHVSFEPTRDLPKPCEIMIAPLIDRFVEVEPSRDQSPCPSWTGTVRVRQLDRPSQPEYSGMIGMLMRDAHGIVRAKQGMLEIRSGGLQESSRQ